jgi:hypothetical protein
VQRIKGLGRKHSVTGKIGDLVIVMRGDNCHICAGRAQEIIDWITQAISTLNSQLKQDCIAFILFCENIDRGIVIYGFTDGTATGTTKVLEEIEKRFGGTDAAILVWRLMPDGSVEYECIGRGCQNYSDEELRKMACKAATGKETCVARKWDRSIPDPPIPAGINATPTPPPTPGDPTDPSTCRYVYVCRAFEPELPVGNSYAYINEE